MKPFNLEEYKKDPSRLRHINGKLKWHRLCPDDHIAFQLDGQQPGINSPWMCSEYFTLTPKYEVRRARPWRYTLRRDTSICIGYPPDQNTAWEFCGPEFEYKVEV